MHPNFIGEVEPGSKEDELLSSLDRERMPRHIAVIMDGNGRWAKQRGRPRIFGHRAGAESVRAIVDTCARLEITAVTLYAFSTENWKRPKSEVSGLMQMLKRFLRSELEAVRKNNIRFQAIGKISGLGEDVQREIASAIDKTAANSGTVLSVALNYGGRAEIVDACIKAARALLKDGRDIKSLAEADIESNLYTHGLPDVDLLIRTSGEMRISNFLLWQLAYSEIYVTPTLFPDFRRRDLFEAIREFQHRDRRFGDIRSNSTAAEHRR
ncbi:MAG: isoprenyl transferase [Pyrinomonadaceae bacterium]